MINGSEGEPACRKDTVLLNRAPHLILDGALLAAEALGARTLVVAVTRNSTEISVRNALAERGLSDRRGQHLRARVVRTPERMVSGEASAVIRAVNGGPALPPGRRERAAESGVGGAPTLLSNAETYAQLAVAARIGSRRYGHTGLPDEPGTVLLTVSGAVARPMVVEVPTGVPLRYVLQLAGAPPLPQGVLTGGYHGNWIDAIAAHDAVVSRASLAAAGGALGAGAILPIGPETCPIGESLRIANWLAAETAGQCGPCKLGLPAAAGGLSDVLNGGGPAALEALREVTQAVKGRGRASIRTARRVSWRPRCPRSRTTSPRMSWTAAAAGRPSAYCRCPPRATRIWRSPSRVARSWRWTGRCARATACARTSFPS